jgi:hypothetical protein
MPPTLDPVFAEIARRPRGAEQLGPLVRPLVSAIAVLPSS